MTRFGQVFRRGPWEGAATLVIAAGVIMLMQPFSLAFYGWSFATTLAGTVLFLVASHFPDVPSGGGGDRG
ncbi:MAG: hypothetical protein GC191_10780 [Azospirillum sp.]|nr:hypothetical protein [Azospirillum sp.]